MINFFLNDYSLNKGCNFLTLLWTKTREHSDVAIPQGIDLLPIIRMSELTIGYKFEVVQTCVQAAAQQDIEKCRELNK